MNRFLGGRNVMWFPFAAMAFIVSIIATLSAMASEAVLSPEGPYLTVTNLVTAGLLEARIYTDSGHISLAGPDLAENPLANTITFAPPQVQIGGASYPIGDRKS